MIVSHNGHAVCRNHYQAGQKTRYESDTDPGNGHTSNGHAGNGYGANGFSHHELDLDHLNGKLPYKLQPETMRFRLRGWVWRHLKPRPELMLGFFVTCFLIFFLLRFVNRPDAQWSHDDEAIFHHNLDAADDVMLRVDRWIVLTSINAPTRQVRGLAKIPGWTVLVVGDANTPAERWRSEKDVIFLDIKEQEHLQFTITPLLPYNSYARKMIGYLYAIQHGAMFIYDTDDDNLPFDNFQTFRTTSPLHYLTVESSNLTFNPYAHFGQSSLWPRGYPLEHFTTSDSRRYTLCEMHTPAVQQGLVNGDPDVDAILRITRKYRDRSIDVVFDSKAPPVIVPRGTFTPFNSQNTLFTYKALWALVLPVTTSIRTCDIYRSYWMQPLLWLLGQRVGFFPANCFHDRNKHSLAKDAEQEEDFHRMGKLLSKLKQWHCEKVHFFACVSDLAKDFVHWGYWKKDDSDLIDAWLTDLASLGYISPTMKDESYAPCSVGNEDAYHLTFHPREQETIMPNVPGPFLPDGATNINELSAFIRETCNSDEPVMPQVNGDSPFKDILLVVDVKTDSRIIPFLEAQYQGDFHNILYCGSEEAIPHAIVERWKVSYIQVPKALTGIGCLSTAIHVGYNVSGYLYAASTALLHPEALANHNFHQMWSPKDWKIVDADIQQACDSSNFPCQKTTASTVEYFSNVMSSVELGDKLKGKLRTCFDKIKSEMSGKSSVYLLKDFVFYIPSRLSKIYSQLSKVYLTVNPSKRIELLIVLLMDCIETNSESLTSETKINSHTSDYMFPYKTDLIAREGASQFSRRTFCQQFIAM